MIDDSILGKELNELDPAQATEILDQFLANEREVFKTLHLDSVVLDYSKGSVIKLFEYVISSEFDATNVKKEANSVWIGRVAYYFGESLRRFSNHLRWGIGETGTAGENHPVIKGFSDGTEAEMIIIARNLATAVAVDRQPLKRIVTAVDAWFDAARPGG